MSLKRKANLNMLTWIKENARSLVYVVSPIVLILILILYVLFSKSESKSIVYDKNGDSLMKFVSSKYSVYWGDKKDIHKYKLKYTSVAAIPEFFSDKDKKEIKEKLSQRSLKNKINDWLYKKFNNSEQKGFELSLVSASVEDTGVTILNSDNNPVVETIKENITTSDNVFDSVEVPNQHAFFNLKSGEVFFDDAFKSINLKYSLIEDKGVKEQLIIQKTDAMRPGCENIQGGCQLPKNKFTFQIKLDEGVRLEKKIIGGHTKWYVLDEYSQYISHFDNLFLYDSKGAKTNNNIMKIEEDKLIVIADLAWMMNSEREYPIWLE